MLRFPGRLETDPSIPIGAVARRWSVPLGMGSRARALANSNALIIAIPVVLAGFLCAYKLGVRSLWLDESATVSIASQHGAALWAGIAHDGGNMLIYYLLMHVVIGAFGDGAAVIRAPSVIAQAATAGVVAVLALRLFNRRDIALLAGLLVAVSLPLVYWGQNARGYALMVTLSTASFIPLAQLFKTAEAGVPWRWRTVIGYAACITGALYVGFDAVFVIPAQLALLLVFRERWRVLVGALAVSALACVPLVVLAIERGSGQLFWVPPIDFYVLGQSVVTLFSAAMPPNFHATSWSDFTSIFSGALLVAAMVAAVFWARKDGLRNGSWRAMLLVSWLVVPSLVALMAAVIGEPIELARCTVLIMPVVALLTAWVLFRPWVPRVASVGAITLLLVLRSSPLTPSYGQSPEDWRSATAFVVNVAAAQGACLMFYPQDSRMAFDYYVRHGDLAQAAKLRSVLPAIPWTQVTPYVEQYAIPTKAQLRTIVNECPRLWLISSHQGQENGPRLSGLNYVKYERLVARLGWVYPHQNLVQFGYAARVFDWQLSRTPISGK